METGLARLGEISHLVLGGISVKWDKIFHVNTSSHLTGMDIFADFGQEYSIEQHNLKIQKLLKSYTKCSLFNYNKKCFKDAIFT